MIVTSGFDLYNITLENNDRDRLVKKWNSVAKKQSTILAFLTKNIHKN